MNYLVIFLSHTDATETLKNVVKVTLSVRYNLSQKVYMFDMKSITI